MNTALTITMVVFGLFMAFVFVGIGLEWGKAYPSKKLPYEKRADDGFIFCKLGENYVWLNKEEYIRLFLKYHGE